MPLISVIVPVYNCEKYLKNSIDSIRKQSLSDFELILIDDGSKDSSGKICDQYAIEDSRIKVIHKKNEGQGVARNTGIVIAEGEWISFVDADDCISNQYLEELYSLANNADADIASCGYYEAESCASGFSTEQDNSVKKYNIDESTLIELYKQKGIVWLCCTKLIKRDILIKRLFPDKMIYEDNAVVCQWIYFAKRIVHTSAALYFYRINYEGTTKSPFSIKQFDYLKALGMQLDFYKTINYMLLWNQIVHKYFMTALSFYKIAQKNFKDIRYDKIIRSEVKKFIKSNKKELKSFDLENIIETFFPFEYFLYRTKRRIKKLFNKYN